MAAAGDTTAPPAALKSLETVWSNAAATRTDCTALLSRILENVLKAPEEAKFRSVSIDKTKARLGAVSGAVAFLESAGWSTTATHYELSATADPALLRACLNALNTFVAERTAAAKSAAAAPVAPAPAKTTKLVGKAFKETAKTSEEDDETARAIAEIERKKKAAKAKEELRRREKATDYKPVCSSTANTLRFGSTKGNLPPPCNNKSA